MKKITFQVQGNPVGQPRIRAVAFGGHARVYDPGTAKGWKSEIARECREAMKIAGITEPIEGPVSVNAVFFFPRPKSHFDRRGLLRDLAAHEVTRRPDIDNLAKAALDAMNGVGIWRDDSQVSSLQAYKQYGTHGFCIISVSDRETY